MALIMPIVLMVAAAPSVRAQRSTAPSPPSTQAAVTARIVAAARAVLTALDDAGRAKIQFPFDSSQRSKWSNLPSPMFQRNGVRMADLTQPQRAAVTGLLSVALSSDGYRKVLDIMRGDEVLRKTQASGGGGGGGRGRGGVGGGGGAAFGEDEYYLSFVGTPSETAPWILHARLIASISLSTSCVELTL